jgi:hypothetical protein
MPDTYTSVIPISVQRRLLLNLMGYRWVSGGYQCGRQYISEERLDHMDEASWQALIRPWLASSTS